MALPPPPLPEGYVRRSDDATAKLLTRLLDPTSAGTAHVVYGSGGFGKTVITSALLHENEPALAKNYPGGVHWLTVGEDPPSVVTLQAQLTAALGRSRPVVGGDWLL